MAVYSINQVRQLYVVKDANFDAVANLADAGDTLVKQADKDIYLQYMSVDGLTSSPKVFAPHIKYVNYTAAADMRHPLKRYKVTIDTNVASTPVAGQDYIIRIAFRQYIGLSEEDQYFKYGEAIASANTTASDLYKELAVSLAKNLSRDITPLVNVYVANDDGTIYTPVTGLTKVEDFGAATITNIVIEEVEQDWKLGMMPQAFIPFTIQFLPIFVDGEQRLWGKVEEIVAAKTVNNGHNIADLEYFCMGARGDMYRGMGYPNIIPTKYLVDPSKEYDVIDIHYFYTGDNESVQKSEKTLTFVCENTVTSELVNRLNTALTAAGREDLKITL